MAGVLDLIRQGLNTAQAKSQRKFQETMERAQTLQTLEKEQLALKAAGDPNFNPFKLQEYQDDLNAVWSQHATEDLKPHRGVASAIIRNLGSGFLDTLGVMGRDPKIQSQIPLGIPGGAGTTQGISPGTYLPGLAGANEAAQQAQDIYGEAGPPPSIAAGGAPGSAPGAQGPFFGGLQAPVTPAQLANAPEGAERSLPLSTGGAANIRVMPSQLAGSDPRLTAGMTPLDPADVGRARFAVEGMGQDFAGKLRNIDYLEQTGAMSPAEANQARQEAVTGRPRAEGTAEENRRDALQAKANELGVSFKDFSTNPKYAKARIDAIKEAKIPGEGEAPPGYEEGTPSKANPNMNPGLENDAMVYGLTGRMVPMGLSNSAYRQRVSERWGEIRVNWGLQPEDTVALQTMTTENKKAFGRINLMDHSVGQLEGTLSKNMDFAKELNAAYKRSDLPFINKYLSAFKTGVGETDALDLARQLHTVAQEWAKIMEGGAMSAAGVHVDSAAAADKLMADYMSKGQLDSLFDLISRDAANRRQSIGDEKDKILGEIRHPAQALQGGGTTGGGGGQGGGAGGGGGAQGGGAGTTPAAPVTNADDWLKKHGLQ